MILFKKMCILQKKLSYVQIRKPVMEETRSVHQFVQAINSSKKISDRSKVTGLIQK